MRKPRAEHGHAQQENRLDSTCTHKQITKHRFSRLYSAALFVHFNLTRLFAYRNIPAWKVGVHSSNQAISRLSSLEMIPVHRRQRSHRQSDPAPDKFDSCFMGFPYQSLSWCRPLHVGGLQYGVPFAILWALFLAPVWLAAQPSARSITRRRVDNGGRTRAGCCGSNIGIPCAPGATSVLCEWIPDDSFEHSMEVRINTHPHSNLPVLAATSSPQHVRPHYAHCSRVITPRIWNVAPLDTTSSPRRGVQPASDAPLKSQAVRSARRCCDGVSCVNGVFAKVKGC